jgi:transcriptional regulator with XRE-family HTH domain
LQYIYIAKIVYKVIEMKTMTNEKAERKILKVFGEYLGVARKIKKMSLANLAEKTGVNISTISRWENGETLPSKNEMLYKIADALGLDKTKVLEIARLSAYPPAHSDTNKPEIEIINPLSESELKKLWVFGDDFLSESKSGLKKMDYDVNAIANELRNELRHDLQVLFDKEFEMVLSQRKLEVLIRKAISNAKPKSGTKKAVAR